MIVSWLNRAGTVSLRGLVAFGKFWYGFVIGDDWTVAAAVAAALVVTWLLHTAGVAAWWLPPLVAVAATGASLPPIHGCPGLIVPPAGGTRFLLSPADQIRVAGTGGLLVPVPGLVPIARPGPRR